MARRSSKDAQPAAPTALFAATVARRPRRALPLFLPRLLDRETANGKFAGPDFDNARTILRKWADLDAAGDLLKRKETALDADFLAEVFGDALGYARQTDSPADYNLERNFTVPGCGTADGALGEFPAAKSPLAVIELKDAGTDLDRDRFNGRTPVQQLWDYLVNLPDCPWGILSNFSTIRLYHRDRTQRAYQGFTLEDLKRSDSAFRHFYCLFQRGGLIPTPLSQIPRAAQLLKQTTSRQREVGDSLYSEYSRRRAELVHHLEREKGWDRERAIRAAQLLVDRIIFIAFCEDRDLLKPDTIERAYQGIPNYPPKNARIRNFMSLFRALDEGHPELGLPGDAGYNGGLFEKNTDVDDLDLLDIPWAEFFNTIGSYDFKHEINVDVLGHLFERSVAELERLRVGPLFALLSGKPGGNGKANGSAHALAPSPMPKSAQRKLFGIYYTPPEFTGLIVENTIDAVVAARFADIARRYGLDPQEPHKGDAAAQRKYWSDAANALAIVRVVDPACGSGAFLIRAYEAFEEYYKDIADGLRLSGDPDTASNIDAHSPDLILSHNLYGVDLSAESVEITRLALWIRSARRGKTLADLSHNIIEGNSLVDDPAVHPKAMDWAAKFPEVFADGGFDCVIGNPPWERLKVQEREFFARHDPETAQAVSAADRRTRIADLPTRDPALFASYERAKATADRMLTYGRDSGRYPLTGKGDINTYMLFAELALRIVAPRGMVGLLTPSGIATDETTSEFFASLMDSQRVALLYGFENKRPWFPDVHRSFKFSALVFGGGERRFDETDFVFFARQMEDLEVKRRHIPLSAADLKLLNPNTRTSPIFRSRRDADLTRRAYRKVRILIDENRKKGGNPWGVRFLRMFDQTNDAEKFVTPDDLKTQGFKLDGNRWRKGKQVYLPLYEAKMVQAYDHRAASVVVEAANWMRQGQKAETGEAEHQNSEHVVLPRFWVAEPDVIDTLGSRRDQGFIGFKDITSATNERTVIAAAVPWAGFTNHVVLVRTEAEARRELCLLANLNSIPLDYIARQKVGAVTLNFFIVEQFPIFEPGKYDDKCTWDKRQTLERWISDRVLRLTCTADDMKPLADACAFKGSTGAGVHKWKEQEREELGAELDAAYFHLYGIEREDVEYILNTFTTTRDEDAGGNAESLARRRLILDHFDGLAASR